MFLGFCAVRIVLISESSCYIVVHKVIYMFLLYLFSLLCFRIIGSDLYVANFYIRHTAIISQNS